ncbi:MAG: efflux transporter outer membrane subunit [Alphaproteobacteria bacterium]
MSVASAGLGILCMGVGMALASCTLAPDYEPPAMPAPAAYREAGDWMPARPADETPRGAWWRAFNDPALDALQDKSATANQSLKAALARYDGARAAAQAAQSAFFPLIAGSAGASRQKQSGNTANRPGVKIFNDFSVDANLSYEVDLWGRIRNAVAAAEGEAEASKADLAVATLDLQAELAMNYFTLRGDDALLEILDKTVDVDAKSLDLLQRRLKGGITTQADVDQAETLLENAKAQAAEFRLHRAQTEHAIAVLIGEMPGGFSHPVAPLAGEAVPAIDPGLPSTLLERRPDIAAAERRMMAANAEIGVARAAWFPAFDLGAAFGAASAAAGNWLSAPSTFWSLGPSAAMTLFDGGHIAALTDEARAAYDEAAADYRQTVLIAYREVEDNLAALRQLDIESRSQEAAKNAAERLLAQENSLYLGGAATYIDVAVAQNAALQAEIAFVNVRVRRLAAAIQLVRALGGGWQEEKSALPIASPGKD